MDKIETELEKQERTKKLEKIEKLKIKLAEEKLEELKTQKKSIFQ